jgi:hypothetical protein
MGRNQRGKDGKTIVLRAGGIPKEIPGYIKLAVT